MIANLCLALLSFSPIQAEAIPEPPVSVSMEVRRPGNPVLLPSGSEVFAGEMLQVDIHLAVERNFLQDHLIPTWRLPLDVPMELRTPWLDGALGSDWREESSTGSVSIVLDREVNRVQEILGTSDENQHYGLRRWILVPETEGEFTLSPASAHFTWASDFADDMVRGLVPVDRQQSVIASEAWTGLGQALPPAPEEFSGVIGNVRWSVQTTAPKDAQWVWHMEVHGSAWPQASLLPEFPSPKDLRLQGVRGEELVDGYRATMEFQIEEGFEAVRDWTWTVFSPGSPGKYLKWRMPDIGLGAASHAAVLAKAPSSNGSANAAKAPSTAAGKQERGAEDWIAWAVLLLTLTAVGVVAWRWRRPPVAEEEPVPSAQPRSAQTRPAPPRPAAADLLDDLANQLGCHRADLYEPDLQERLAQQSWPQELTQNLLTAVEAHAAHHFQGKGTGIAPETEVALRRQLAQELS